MRVYWDLINLIDVRPLDKKFPGVRFIQGGAKFLKNLKDSSIYSLSSLCVVEHFGLGRYGDEIDPEGCFKALVEMERVFAKRELYLSVSVGREDLEFNAHRIFYARTIIESLLKLKLIQFSTTELFGDNIRYNEDIYKYDNHETQGCLFGLFEFRKE